MKYITIKLTKKEALYFDLLSCACGHRENNHFDFVPYNPCAHCKCDHYVEILRAGKIVKRKSKKGKKKWQ